MTKSEHIAPTKSSQGSVEGLEHDEDIHCREHHEGNPKGRALKSFKGDRSCHHKRSNLISRSLLMDLAERN